jgi:(p)ppGpp synthase/HD superfamily hydrolase
MINATTADAMASAAHGRDRTKSAVLFIEHVRRVAGQLRDDPDPNAVPAALLHDVVEKTSVELGDLRAAGADDRLVDVVDALTERDGEPLETYLRRCAANPLALRVKRADITDKLELLAEGRVPVQAAAEIRASARHRLAVLECLAARAS